MPFYDSREKERTPTPLDCSEAHVSHSSNAHNDEDTGKENEICLLPEEQDDEDDNFDEYPAYHVGTRFWTWCRKSFMGKIDTQFLEEFKEIVLDPYSDEALQKYFVNEPWKYRKRAPPPASRRKSLNTSLNGKNSKKVSISNEVISPTTNGTRSAPRKASLAGYRIPNRRNSEKDKDLTNNNNKIMPIIGSMVYTACKEYKDGKSIPDTPTTRRSGKSRMMSPEFTKEKKCAKLEIDTESEDEIEYSNGHSHRGTSSRLHSPRQVKKERMDDEYEKMANGHSSLTNGVNGHSKGPTSPKRKNGDIRSYFSATPKPATTTNTRKLSENGSEDIEMPSDIEDFDAKAVGSRIVAKLIAGGILPDSSAHIFEQMTQENYEDGNSAGVSTKVEMSEEGKDDAEDQEIGELAEELQNLQMNLKEEMAAKNALFMLTWRRAKAHFAFFHTFNELKRGDYDLFKLGVNMYRDFPNRKLPGISETILLKHSLRKRNHLARTHYSKMYRRHPKFRWHRDHLPAGRRIDA